VAVFCLLHGAWHDGSCWDEVAAALRRRGHLAFAPDLPLHDPGAGYDARVRPALDALDGVDRDVVVVGHSMAALYAPAVAAARPGSLLVHLCPGLTAVRPEFPWPPTGPDGTCAWDAGAAIAAMYARLTPARARALAARLCPMAPGSGERPHVLRRDLPTRFVYAAEDELLDPAAQRALARERLGVEPIEIAGGHFPMAEDPEALAALLDRLAADQVR
jgi:pimeloyl-ACP methyl ester carboxylesterase